MRYIRYILTLIMGLITSFFIWVYIQRANLDYNSQGRFLSPEDGVIYHEQAKDIYGMLAFLGLILTAIFTVFLIKRKTQIVSKT